MEVKTLTGIAVLSWALTLFVQTQVFAESMMEEGKRFYNESNFGKAEKAWKQKSEQIQRMLTLTICWEMFLSN